MATIDLVRSFLKSLSEDLPFVTFLTSLSLFAIICLTLALTYDDAFNTDYKCTKVEADNE